MKVRQLPHAAESRDVALGWRYRSREVLASGEASYSDLLGEQPSLWRRLGDEVYRATGVQIQALHRISEGRYRDTMLVFVRTLVQEASHEA